MLMIVLVGWWILKGDWNDRLMMVMPKVFQRHSWWIIQRILFSRIVAISISHEYWWGDHSKLFSKKDMPSEDVYVVFVRQVWSWSKDPSRGVKELKNVLIIQGIDWIPSTSSWIINRFANHACESSKWSSKDLCLCISSDMTELSVYSLCGIFGTSSWFNWCDCQTDYTRCLMWDSGRCCCSGHQILQAAMKRSVFPDSIMKDVSNHGKDWMTWHMYTLRQLGSWINHLEQELHLCY